NDTALNCDICELLGGPFLEAEAQAGGIRGGQVQEAGSILGAESGPRTFARASLARSDARDAFQIELPNPFFNVGGMEPERPSNAAGPPPFGRAKISRPPPRLFPGRRVAPGVKLFLFLVAQRPYK